MGPAYWTTCVRVVVSLRRNGPRDRFALTAWCMLMGCGVSRERIVLRNLEMAGVAVRNSGDTSAVSASHDKPLSLTAALSAWSARIIRA